MYPYPAISPYDHQFSQHYNDDDSLWKWDSSDGGRKYFFTLEGFAAELRKPGRHHIGAVLDPDDVPLLLVASNVDPLTFNLQNTRDLVYKFDFKTEGIRSRWGFDNPDRSGLVVEGFWATNVTENANPGDVILGYVPNAPTGGDITDPTTFRQFLAIPANDGSETGTIIRYDSAFNLSYSAEAFGATIDYLKTPVWGRDTARLRPVFGLRYVNIQEQFGFVGADSSLSYTGTNTFLNGYLIAYDNDVDSVEPNPFFNPPYSSFIDSNVWTNLLGPEIGLQFELGGAKLKLSGHSKVALLGNAEKIKLAGDDFGNGFLIDLDVGDNFFSQTEYHTHLSPAFEQTLSLESQIFGLVPVLKRMPVLEAAVFRVGWTYLTVSEIARPADTIVYNALPMFPEIDANRSRWSMYSFNFGITWRR